MWLRAPLALGAGEVKAAALTSLGFGHVGALVVLAHPSVFEAAVQAAHGGEYGGEHSDKHGDAVQHWRSRATQRLRAGSEHLEAGMVGRKPLFVQVENRRFQEDNAHDGEIALLLDPQARLGADGTYPRG